MDTLFNNPIIIAATDTVLHSIGNISASTSTTAENTTLNWYDYSALFVAILALVTSFAAMIYAKRTYASQKLTEENTSNTQSNTKRISLNSQKGLLIDLVRHLYRNLVVTYAIKTKLDHLGYDTHYPSEEHLLKLKAPVENIHLDAFYEKDEDYKQMNKLYLQLRNYNTEIDAALRHFPVQEVSTVIKKHDIDTLMFKPGYLVGQIIETLCKLFPSEDIYREASDIILDVAMTNQKDKHGDPWPHDFVPYDDHDSRFITSIFAHTTHGLSADREFLEMFNADALIECGNNNKNFPKIYVIPYKEEEE